MEFYKINQQCLEQLQNVAKYLSEIEVKGKNVSYLYHAGLTLDAILQQVSKDNDEQKPQIEEGLKETDDG